jgi:hypothetical protein
LAGRDHLGLRREAAMKGRSIKRLGVLLLTVLVWASLGLASSYDVYKAGVPDQDKPGPDNSCWLAAAANALSAAGWGEASTVYQTLRSHFQSPSGEIRGGWSPVAINWWLLNHGLNPDSAHYNYSASRYTDVTVIDRYPGALSASDYDKLLSELERCQYVNVGGGGHTMTLVGGNRSTAEKKVSVWHDPDGDEGPPEGDDDDWQNSFDGDKWSIALKEWDLQRQWATILCPGLKKPKAAIENYDIRYYMDMDICSGDLYERMMVAGAHKDDYTGPEGTLMGPHWSEVPGEENALIVPNERLGGLHKEIWLLIDFVDRPAGDAPAVEIVDAAGRSYEPDAATWSPDRGQVMLHWTLADQPDWEKVLFPSEDYRDLYDIKSSLPQGSIKDWNLATLCVPEPVTALGVLLGVGGLAGYVRRRRVAGGARWNARP